MNTLAATTPAVNDVDQIQRNTCMRGLRRVLDHSAFTPEQRGAAEAAMLTATAQQISRWKLHYAQVAQAWDEQNPTRPISQAKSEVDEAFERLGLAA